jgi:microcin C transport system permease protein
MTSYFIRRLLLIVPTFLGITIITFFILQLVPGGPLEIELMKFRYGSFSGGDVISSPGKIANINLPESALKEMKEFYGFDKPLVTRYLIWLGNLMKFNFGKSYVYSEPVLDVISSRFPVSIYFGMIGFILTYIVCVPLGVIKAVKNGSKFDFISSFVVFVGYSIPGWAFGALLLILFGGGSFFNVFPLGGFRSDNFETMTFFQQIIDQLYHTILPVTAYLIGNFATLTIITKNSVIENLSQDYIRTAFAKGLTERKVIYNHALRNSLIPIATGLGHFLSLILAGSFLIEKVFNIQGMGLLGYNSVINRDYPVIMGILVISSMLMMLGNIFSDIIYAFVDPRIKFK